jgi:hypothetical protein
VDFRPLFVRQPCDVTDRPDPLRETIRVEHLVERGLERLADLEQTAVRKLLSPGQLLDEPVDELRLVGRTAALVAVRDLRESGG